MTRLQKIVHIVVGPTASGKSSKALERAQTLDGVIINADSMQVYGALKVLTARPSLEDLKQAPHVLYGHIANPNEPYSVAQWRREALAEIDRAFKRDKAPLIVGGTGLYIKALLEGLNEIPDIAPSIRADFRARAQGGENLYTELQHLDPQAAQRLKPADTQRIVRALEVLVSTGKSLKYWQNQRTDPLPYETDITYINPPRETVVAHARKRLEQMFKGGAIQEVESLLSKGLTPESLLRKAVGVREIEAYLAGDLTYEEALEKAFIATRQYIKRQQTWFNRQL